MLLLYQLPGSAQGPRPLLQHSNLVFN